MERRVLLVTGGGRGIGAAVARLAAARGYDVCLTYLGDAARAEEAAEAARAAGARALAVRADVADPAARERCFAAVDAEFGGRRLDALVNNAGITGPAGRLADTPDAAALPATPAETEPQQRDTLAEHFAEGDRQFETMVRLRDASIGPPGR